MPLVLVQLTIAYSLNTVALVCQQIGAITVDGRVEEYEIVHRNFKFDHDHVAVVSGDNMIISSASGIHSRRHVCRCWSRGGRNCGGDEAHSGSYIGLSRSADAHL